MTRGERAEAISGWFLENSADAASELVFGNAFELILAVILSAQCTDKRVNTVTPGLLKKWPDAAALSGAAEDEVFDCIRSISYPRSKAAHLIGMAKGLMERFGGEVPSDTDDLMSLPGVGRKTACVVSSIIYDNPVIAVDTHVFRVSHRLGLSNGRTPEAVEKDLERHIAPELRPKAHHWLILHGRYVCTAKNPHCGECGLSMWCKYFQTNG